MPSKLAAPRGTQDIFPPQSGRWQELESRIHALARRYGYGEIRTPVFESTELFVRGVGETSDIVEKEMYTFDDKGGRSMTLRPEWTAPVVRAALQHGLFTQGPQRLYYLGPIFRYERPQAGRYRQSHQFGIECAGYAQPEADAEVISLAWDLLRAYKIAGVTLKLNSIGDEKCRPAYRDALRAHFVPHRDSLSADSQRRLERNPLRILDSKAAEDRELVASAPAVEDFLCAECRAHFDAVKRALDADGVTYETDSHIVRGLDYYTRTVFEFRSDALGAQNTICAGGRYDGLVGSLGGPDVPAVGFALGLERFLWAIESAGTSEEARREGVQAIAIGVPAMQALLPLVAAMRRTSGRPVFIDYGGRKLLAQLKLADRNNARYALILGDQELAEKRIVLRDLVTRADRPLAFGKDTLEALGELKG